MKTLFLFINLISIQQDTITFDYGNEYYMSPDIHISNTYNLKENLEDGVYIVLDNYGGPIRYKRREIVILNSLKTLDIKYFKNSYYIGILEEDTISGYAVESQPTIKEKYELVGRMQKLTEYHENQVVKSIEIVDTELQKQTLLFKRWHYDNGGLHMIMEKQDTVDQYWIQYYYDTGELNISGQFDQYNRPSGIWTIYHKNGNRKEEGTVCSDCIVELHRPWVERATSLVYKEGDWTYYNEDGTVRKTVLEKSDKER
ncbi:MAG: hypothetical protein RIC35_06625 [Marinoscillum sp.]